MIIVAPDFDSHPAIAKALDEIKVPAEDRMGVVMKVIPEKIWAEVKAKRADKLLRLTIETIPMPEI